MQPKKLGPYQLEKMLGRGGMGAVYRGVHLETGNPAALKLLLDPFEEDEQLRQRFEGEIETLKMLRHPHIVRLFAFGQEEGLLYYVMELVEGASLQQELRAGAVYSPKEVTQIGIEMCRALKHAHDRGIIHRDIKPANIILTPDRVAKLSDFGIARFFGSSHRTVANCVMGTLEYMPPEQAKAQPIGPKSDIYALGAVLYTLLLRRPPYRAKTLPELLANHQEKTIESVGKTRPETPEKLHRMIERMLHLDPDQRPTTAYVVGRRLQEILEDCFSDEDDCDESSSSRQISDAAYGMSAGRDPEQSPPRQDPLPKVDSDQLTLDDCRNQDLKKSESEEVPPGGEGDETATLRRKESSRQTADFSLMSEENPEGKGDASREEDYQTSADSASSGEPSDEKVSEEKNATPPEEEELTRTMLPGDSAKVVEIVGKDDGFSLSDETFSSEDPPDDPDHQATETKHTSSFVEVQEEELGKVEYFEAEKPPMISIQVIVLSLCLLLTGVGAWYLLQPPTADDLYHRIQSNISSDRDRDFLRSLRSEEEEMRRFLSLFPDDPRSGEIREYLQEIELSSMQRSFERRIDQYVDRKGLLPVEIAYLEALETARLHPEKAIERLRSLIALYRSEASPGNRTDQEPASRSEDRIEEGRVGSKGARHLAGPREMCVELARRRLESLEAMVESSSEEQRELILNRLDLADELEESDPRRAVDIRRAVLELYSGKDWADEALERAREGLASEQAVDVSGDEVTTSNSH